MYTDDGFSTDTLAPTMGIEFIAEAFAVSSEEAIWTVRLGLIGGSLLL